MFALAGIAAIIFGIVLGVNNGRGMVKTVAVIERIDEEYMGVDENRLDQYEYHVFVKYRVDGQDYSGRELGYYEDGFKEGQEITIYYNPSNPAEIKGEVGSFSVFLIIAGAVCLVVGAVVFIKSK